MYIILVYDITLDEGGARIMRNVFKVCKKYLSHIQKSTFEGELTEAKLFKLREELKVYLREELDSLIVFKSENNNWMEKQFWAKVDDKTSNFF